MTLFSKLSGADSKTFQLSLQEQLKIWPPPISFAKKSKKKSSKKKSDDDDDDSDNESESDSKKRSFDVYLDPENPEESTTYSMKVPTFEEGNAEDWVLWRIEVDDLFTRLKIEKKTVCTKR